MPSALITGGPSAAAALVAALHRRADDVCVSTCSQPVSILPAVDCYVQLPWGGEPTGTHWPQESLTSRLDLLAVVAPSLRPRATVLLAVEEDHPARFGRS